MNQLVIESTLTFGLFPVSFPGDLPPQISVVNAGGHVHEGPGGELIVYPGSIIHLDCIFNRKLGNPTWSWASSGKVYPTGKLVGWPDARPKTCFLSVEAKASGKMRGGREGRMVSNFIKDPWPREQWTQSTKNGCVQWKAIPFCGKTRNCDDPPSFFFSPSGERKH